MGSRLQNLPNWLSFSRPVLAAAFLIVFDSANKTRFWASLLFLCAAVLTDLLDGPLARRCGAAGRTGYFIDGIADKIVYVAVLLVIFREDRAQFLLPWLLISREIILYALRAMAGASEQSLRELRAFSLWYAFLIRVYFLGFFTEVAGALYHPQYLTFLRIYILFGITAVLVGYSYLVRLVKRTVGTI
jgi:phosphatidylglycerophosphate synthase